MSGLELSGVSKSDGALRAVEAVDLPVAPGELVAMAGISGRGKSALLGTVAGLEEPDAGAVRVGGRAVTRAEPSDRGISVVFQNSRSTRT